MPKFTYSAAKGIEQSTGSGFIIEDVSIQPSTVSYTASVIGTPYTITDSEQVILLNQDLAQVLVLPNGNAIGEEKKVIVVTAASSNLTVKDAGGASPRGAAGTTVGAVFTFVYTATDTWKLLA